MRKLVAATMITLSCLGVWGNVDDHAFHMDDAPEPTHSFVSAINPTAQWE